MTYAPTVNERQKEVSRFEVEVFGRGCGYSIVGTGKDPLSGEYYGELFSFAY